VQQLKRLSEEESKESNLVIYKHFYSTNQCVRLFFVYLYLLFLVIKLPFI
jgi:hypothetical protein